MYQTLKLILFFCFVLAANCSRRSGRGGRQLDLDAILEGRLSNHVIGERQSRMLGSEVNATTVSDARQIANSTGELGSSNKTAKLIEEEESMQKHASFVSHYGSEDELSGSSLKKSIENLDQLIGTSARVINTDHYPQASAMMPVSYLNPIYPTEDKILAALINQAAGNIVSGQAAGDLSAMQSNPTPIYASSADKPLPDNPSGGLSSFLGGNANKKKPFASIGSSIQNFAASLFPNRVTNKFIKRKQSGQPAGNQLDYASFASECICVPFYMCRNGYVEQNSVKSNLASSPMSATNQFDQKKQTSGTFDSPSVFDLVENGPSSGSSPSLEKFYNTQDMLVAASLLQPSGYPIGSLKPSSSQLSNSLNNLKINTPPQAKDGKQENAQSQPAIDRRSQMTSDNFSLDQNNNSQKLELPIDERSIDGKIDFNSTEGVLESSEIETLTRMFNSYSPQSEPAVDQQQQNCGILRTCCPVLNQRDVYMAQQSNLLIQAYQQAPGLIAGQPNGQPMFAFENFQPTIYDPQQFAAMSPVLGQPLPQSSQAQPSQTNFIYQPVFQSDPAAGPAASTAAQPSNNGQPSAKKSTNHILTGPSQSTPLSINNQMVSGQMSPSSSPINNQMNSQINSQMNNQMSNQMNNQMNNPINNPISNKMTGYPMMSMINGQMMTNPMIGGQMAPFNKWLQNDKRIYQPNLLIQPSLTSFMLTRTPGAFQARNPSADFFVDGSSTEDHRMSSRKNATNEFCGRRPKLQFNARVENLNYPPGTAKFADYPWNGIILKKLEDNKSLFICGATLISDQWLVSTAHCLKEGTAKDFKIRLGEWDLYREDEQYPFIEQNVAEIIRHPNYDPSTLNNDIALMRLEHPINLAANIHIAPVCRAQYGENFANRRCMLSGFGKSEFKGEYQSVLREVQLPILDHSQCSSLLQQTRLGSSFELHSGFICAGAEKGRDACTGDGGSALTCEEITPSGETIWKAIGLVSWGIGCGQNNHPGVYTNLGYYQSWIDSTVNEFAKLPSSTDNILIRPPKEQFDHNSLNPPTNGDLLSESSNQYASVIKRPAAGFQADRKYELSSIVNERSIKEAGELSIAS